MKKHYLVWLILLSTLKISAQGEAANWFFGKKAGVSFSSGSPEVIDYNPSVPINTLEGSSSISDAFGNLLFYSDGTRVWNRNHEIMPNGANLKGHRSSTQSGIIVPNPDNDDIYYIFTVGTNLTGGDPPSGTQGFRYYTVDMTLDGGLGAVLAGSEVNLSSGQENRWTEKVTAVRQDDCGDYWVISLVDNSSTISDDFTTSDYTSINWETSTNWGSTFYAYRVSGSGVDLNPVRSKIPVDANEIKGYLKVSPNGEYIAIANYDYTLSKEAKSFLFSLDLTSGKIGEDDDLKFNLLPNQRGLELMSRSDISSLGSPYGIEFDATSRFLYLSTHDYNTGGFAGLDGDDEIHILQYDLQALDIKNSQTSIHYESGNVYRAGLQLTYGNQIYVTVPRSYYTDTQYLDLIEFPYLKGNASNYITSHVDLGAGRATQGLPPFIQSLFLNELNITNNGSIDENRDYLYLCEGDNYIIRNNVNYNPAWTYTWTKDGVVLPGATTEQLNISYDGVNAVNKYTLEIDQNDGTCPKQGTSIVTFSPPPTAGQPSNIFECDDDADGFFSFDLTNNDNLILDGLDPTEYQVEYYLNEADALSDNEINRISNSSSYQNQLAYTSETIYARLESVDLSSCAEIVSFQINVTSVPEPTQPENYKECDSNIDGDESDGQTFFDLASKDIEVLGGLDGNRYRVSYHLSQSDADNALNAIDKNTPYLSGSKTIYVRLENTVNITCINTTSFDLIVNEIPPLKREVFDQIDCDNTGLDGADFKDLEDFIPIFVANPIQYDITFHQTLASAELGIEPINNPKNYLTTTESIFIRFENKTTACYNIGTLNITMLSSDVSNTIEQTLKNCDIDQNGIAVFDLNTLYDALTADYPYIEESGAQVSFYSSEIDAMNKNNAISNWSSYQNQIAYDDIVYIRVDNGICSDYGKYAKLEVEPLPLVASTVSDLEVCDDDLDGFFNNFRLDDVRTEILGLNNPADYDISFYNNNADRISDTNRLGDSYTNNVKFGNTVYVRIFDVNTGCINTNLSFNVSVLEAPAIELNLAIQFLCDDDNNGYTEFNFSYTGSETFIEDQILNGLNPAEFSVSYHTSKAKAENNIDALTMPYVNSIAYQRETIWSRVENNTTGCFSITSFDIQVNNTPIFNPVTNYEQCDNNDDGDSQNGRVNTFLLSTKDAELFPVAIDREQFNISYHPSLADADNKVNIINKDLGYTNTTANLQEVFVRMENKNDPSCYKTTSFLLIVNPLPVVTQPVYDFIVCDDDSNETTNYDLNDVIDEISSDPANTTISFFSTEDAALNNDTSLKLPNLQVNSPSRTVFARHENASGCVEVSQINAIVVATAIPNTFSASFEQCDTNENGTTNFDFSTVENQLLTQFPHLDKPNVQIRYFLSQTDAENESNAIADPQNFNNTTNYNQSLFIRVDSQGCFYIGEHINLVVNPLPLNNAAVDDIEVCDDDTDGFYNDFRLDNQRNDILNGENPSFYNIEFYDNPADRIENSNALGNTYTNTTRDGNTIYVRIIDNTTGCINDNLQFQVKVNPLPAIAQNISDLVICDIDSDLTYAFNFVAPNDQAFMDDQILNGLDPNLYTVSYHSSQAAANAASPLTLPYTNTSSRETIWSRVENNATGCFSITSFDIQVNNTPIFNPVTNYEQCDNNDDGDSQNGRVNTFLLSTKDAELFPVAIDREQFNISYHPSLADSDNKVNIINKDLGYTNTTANLQEVFVRMENKNDPSCYKTTSFLLIVNPLPVVTQPVYDFIVCDDDINGLSNYDLSTIEVEISSDPTNTTFSYYLSEQAAWDEDSNLQISPNQNNASSRSIWVRHENSSGCSVLSEIRVFVVTNTISNNIQETIEECDTFESPVNDDKDEIAIFDLSDFDQQIQDYFNGISNLNISHYETKQDAFNKVNSIQNLESYRNNINLQKPDGSYAIWTRVESFLNGNLVEECVYVGNHLNLNVIPKPLVPENLNNLVYCDTDNDGEELFNLQEVRAEFQVFNSDLIVSFHKNINDAAQNVGILPDNYSSFGERIYVRVIDPNLSDDSNVYCANTDLFFDLVVKPLPFNESISDIELCVDDLLGNLAVNLHDRDSEILDGKNPNLSIKYYLSSAEADTEVNEIAEADSNFMLSIPNTTIWARIQDFNDPESCPSIKAFRVTKYQNPIINPISEFRECALFDGTQTFDLNALSIDLLGASQLSSGQFKITYKDQNQNEISNLSNYIISSNATVSYTIVNNSNPNCIAEGDIDLVIAEVPQVRAETYEFIVCDEDLDGITNFDLTSLTSIISQESNVRLTFYTSTEDAINDQNRISSPESVSNEFFGKIFVRHEFNQPESCASFSEVDLRVAISVFDDRIAQQLYTCDDGTGSGIGVFDIRPYDQAVKNLYPSDQPVVISHYRSFEDANKGINAIPLDQYANYKNTQNPGTEKIYTRAQNQLAPNCSVFVESYLTLDVTPAPNAQNIIATSCFDINSDLNKNEQAVFDLRDYYSAIVGGANPDLYSFSFHASYTFAELEEQALTQNQIQDYINNRQDEILFVRVSDNNSNCASIGTITLHVDETPEVPETISPIELCDFGTVDNLINDNRYLYFDLEENKKEEILSLVNDPENYIIEFFNSESAAISRDYNERVERPLVITKTTRTIYYNVRNKETSCYNTGSFDAVLFDAPNPSPVSDIEICDIDEDGIIANFDISYLDDLIQVNQQNNSSFLVSYHSSIEDAENNLNALDKVNFNNVDSPFEMDIFIRVENRYFDSCSNTNLSFKFKVNTIDGLNLTPDPIQGCDENENETYSFNLNEIKFTLTENEAIHPYISFFETENEARDISSNQGKIPSSLLENFEVDSRRIWSRVSFNGCYRFIPIDLEVIPLPSFTDPLDIEICDDKSNFILEDISNEILINNSQSENYKVSYYYNEEDAKNRINAIEDQLDSSDFEASGTELFIRVENTVTGCISNRIASFRVTSNPLPEFSIDSPIVFCQEESSIDVFIDTESSDKIIYTWIDPDGNTVGGIDERATHVNLTKAGEYFIIATNSETGCYVEKSYFANVSEKAVVGPDQIIISQDADNNWVQIKKENIGNGDYLFSIDDINGPYNTSGYFDQLEIGNHVIYITDQLGCETTEVEITILDFPTYFTPNQSQNQFWNVKGIKGNDRIPEFQSGFIEIFDRYGKFIVSIDIYGDGWDGSFKGKQLLPTDYWYHAQLIDQNGILRVYQGHFSLIK